MNSAISGEYSPGEASHELKPPIVSAQSFYPDLTIADEGPAFSDDGDQVQRRRHDDDIHGLRISHSRLLLGLALVWIFVILAVVLLQGFGRWFTPMSMGFMHLSFRLSDVVVIAFITSTTATVLGLYAIAAYWLYGKSKRNEASAAKSFEA